jgi:hypothetical protein
LIAAKIGIDKCIIG